MHRKSRECYKNVNYLVQMKVMVSTLKMFDSCKVKVVINAQTRSARKVMFSVCVSVHRFFSLLWTNGVPSGPRGPPLNQGGTSSRPRALQVVILGV